jgi:hypothetical protein
VADVEEDAGRRVAEEIRPLGFVRDDSLAGRVLVLYGGEPPRLIEPV